MKLPSQKEIFNNWNATTYQPVVTVCCPTFNQKDFLESTIKGLLLQRTSFPFEIIIRDDGSSDGSVEVLKRYKNLYPNIIKLILKKINTLQLGHKSITNFGRKANGKFIALCDGDDYWNNPNKLQKQYEVLKQHPNASLCFHQMQKVEKESFNLEVDSGELEYEFISPHRVIKEDGGFIPTSSIMFRNENLAPLLKFISHAPVGDCFLQFYLSFMGDVIFLKGHYGLQKINVKNSWTSRNSNITVATNHHFQMGKALNNFMKLTPQKYRRDISDLASRHFLRCLRLGGICWTPKILWNCNFFEFVFFSVFYLLRIEKK